MAIRIVEGDAAAANVAGQPANILMYGPPGTQKTTDAVSAFIHDGRCTAFYIPFEDNALKIIASRGLPIPSHPGETIKTWAQLVETVAWLGQNINKFNAVIFDGLSPFSANLYAQATEQFKGGKNKFDIPVAVRACLFQLRDWIRMLGRHTVLIAHALPPAVHDGVFYPGAFEIAPKSLMPLFFGQLDTVLRVGHVMPLGRPPIRVYYTGGDQWPAELGPPPTDMWQWLVKNREGVAHSVVPADLASFLRMRRPPYAGL